MAKRVLHDRYFKQAKREGYLARSAYKLIELDDRRHVIRDGDWVLDLGCSPGSWLQVASERVGPDGLVVGIDLKPTSPGLPRSIRTVIGDFTETGANELLPGPNERFDVVLSDMAPNTSGHGDHFRSVRLCETIVDRLDEFLAPGGRILMKVFDGEALADLIKRCKGCFADVSVLKPKASRDVSVETFIIGLGYRPGRDRHRRDDLRRPRGGPPAPVEGWSS
ncbi:MAG: 23S rRNA methyltransferase [Phycisphaerae bacterium]|nr:23S rRNA methyltransferase [Phycisphaerae bacterium]